MSDPSLRPEPTPTNTPYWSAIEEGRLVYQRCGCGHAWLPPRSECPHCLQGGRWHWETADGRGTIVSWVVYWTAYHRAFEHSIPYNVTIVELLEGPRLITNILDCPDGNGLAIGSEVRLCPEETKRQRRTQFHLTEPRPDTPTWTPPPSRPSG